MKRVFILVLLAFTCVFVVKAVADNSLSAPYGFTISSPTTTTLTLAWSDSNDVAPDSVAIIHLSGSDSLHIAYMSTSNTDTTLTALAPHTQYILLIKELRNDSLVCSSKDTLYTAWPNLETFDMARNNFVPMFGARSWLTAGITYDSLYVYDDDGLDSTMVYRCAEKMAIQVKAVAPHADSAKCDFYIFYGNMNPTNVSNYTREDDANSFWGFNVTASDTLAITANGWSQTLDLIPSDNYKVPVSHFYIRADGAADNGYKSKYIIRLYRLGERP